MVYCEIIAFTISQKPQYGLQFAHFVKPAVQKLNVLNLLSHSTKKSNKTSHLRS